MGRNPSHLPRDTLIPQWGSIRFKTSKQKMTVEVELPSFTVWKLKWGRKSNRSEKANTFQICLKNIKGYPVG